jgi:DNA-binding IclR family transcriptional regulator
MVKKQPPIWPAVVYMVVKAPRTCTEIVEAIGSNPANVFRALNKLRDEGLVEREGTGKGNRPYIWTWNA